jgi:type I restriction enzyme, R subunit
MNADAKEAAFQQDIIDQMCSGGCKLGNPAHYDRKRALYRLYAQSKNPIPSGGL